MVTKNFTHESSIPCSLVRIMERQKYHLVGHHSGVKTCNWLHQSLVHDKVCYKEKFYGIRSHRCLQMTPALYYCTQHCLFCWRAQSSDFQLKWNEMQLPRWDDPDKIVEESIETQRLLLSGYKGNSAVNPKKLREAFQPSQVAISLTGEPTLYEPLGELIRSYHKKGFTTFLVTNGSLPKALGKLSEEPTQLYVSVSAPSKELFERVCRPHFSDGWERLSQTLSMLSSFKCPTVIRTTMMRDVNTDKTAEYAELITRAHPTYVEAKAYMHVGFSRLRLKFESMPSYEDVKRFAAKLADETSYNFVAESRESRVILLSVLKKARKFDGNDTF